MGLTQDKTVPNSWQEKLLLSIKGMKKKTVFHQTSNAVSACRQCTTALSRLGPLLLPSTSGNWRVKVYLEAKHTQSFLHTSVSVMVVVSPGLAFLLHPACLAF